MGPTHLGATDSSVGEIMDQLAQEIRFRHEVGVEDCDQLALRRLHAIFQRARFKAGSIVAMKIRNVETCARVLLDRRSRNVHRFVGRVIQHLDLQKFARIIDLGHRLDQTLDYIHLVKERKLYGDGWQIAFRELAPWLRWKLRIAPELGDQLNAIHAIDGEHG